MVNAIPGARGCRGSLWGIPDLRPGPFSVDDPLGMVLFKALDPWGQISADISGANGKSTVIIKRANMKKTEHKLHIKGIWFQVLMILVLTALIAYATLYIPGKSCTIFTVVQGDTVFYGNSEDQHNADPVIGFFPPSSEGYGSVHFGIKKTDGQVNFEGAANDQGLVWDCNSTPKGKLNPEPNPGKPYYLDHPNFLYTITKKAATVDEAIHIAKTYHFGEVLKGQYHIADANGDAVVISAGADGKVAFTRKDAGDGYLLSTNFNLAQPENGPVDFRWDIAKEKLEAVVNGAVLSPEYAMNLMESVHLESLTTYTLYQNVLDLNANKIYLTYMAQYNEIAQIDMEEEFAKGQRVVEMREFFSSETAAEGDAAYQRFETRFKLAIISVITVSVLLIGLMVYLINRRITTR